MRVIITQFMITMMHIHFFTIWQNHVLLPCLTLNRIDNMMRFVLLFFWFSDLSVYNFWTITIRLDCMQFLHSSRTSCILTLFYTKSIDFFYLQDVKNFNKPKKFKQKRRVTFNFYSTNMDNFKNIMHFLINVMGDEIVGVNLL